MRPLEPSDAQGREAGLGRVLGAGGGDAELVFNGNRVSVWDDDNILVVMVTQQCKCASVH